MTALAQDVMLGERYRLKHRIAIGGMGEVWRAEDILLHRPVAVKVLKTELSIDPTFLERFRNEARSAAAFSHPGIAGVFDYGETDESDDSDDSDAPTAYLVMELVEGEPLSAILAREHRIGLVRTLDYVGQAAAALQVAHRTGMVHRDIKPGNLLIAGDGRVKITDFGIARAASTVRHTQAGMVVGTAQYFSPEQAEGKVVGPASDVYSLGVVAYECLTGNLPFTADSPVTVAVMQIRNVPPPLPPDVPPPVRAVVERAMAKDARWRYANGGELASAVAAAREGRFEQPPPMQPGPGGPPPMPVPAQASGPHPGVPHPLAGPMLGPPSMQLPAPRRHGRRLVLIIGLLATVVLAVVVVWLITHRSDGGDGSATHESALAPRTTAPKSGGQAGISGRAGSTGSTPSDLPSHPVPGQVELDPRRYLDHPLGDVMRALRGQGLQPTLDDTGESAVTGDTKGTVKALMAPPGHVLRTPTWLPTGSQVIVVGTQSGPNQHFTAGSVGAVVHTEPSPEQQANR